MAEHVRVILTEKEVNARIQAIGDEISRDYAGRKVHLVCVLKGGSFFMCEIWTSRSRIRMSLLLRILLIPDARFRICLSFWEKGDQRVLRCAHCLTNRQDVW